MEKKVLIVSYYWPPAGGPGVQRWLKFAKYLPENGVEPIIYSPENANYPIEDQSLLNEVPAEISVLKKPIREPYALAKLFSKTSTKKISSGIISEPKKQSVGQKLMLFVRGNFFIPDARVLWVKPSVAFLSDYLNKNNIDTIITTGPPHSMHLIGLQLKKNLDVKWIADFRDPWTSIGYHKKLKLTRRAAAKHKALEKEVLNAADQIITTSFTTKAEFKAITTKPIAVITNGYDYEKVEKLPLDEKFSMAHIGSLLSGRNPKNLWIAVAELLSEEKGFASDFVLKLVGEVSEEVLFSIKSSGLENHIEEMGYVDHLRALQIQRSSQLLLLVEINSEETKGIIPGKIFEYMISGRPILAIGPEGADIQKIVKETNTGEYFMYNEKEAIKQRILAHYKTYKETTLKSNAIGLQKYSRKALTEQLARLIK